MEEELYKKMEKIYYRAGKELGYWAKRYIQTLRKKGALAYAKTLLKPVKQKKYSAGFETYNLKIGLTYQ